MSDVDHAVEVIAVTPDERDGAIRFAVDARRIEGWTAIGAVMSLASQRVYVVFERPSAALGSESLILGELGLGGRD